MATKKNFKEAVSGLDKFFSETSKKEESAVKDIIATAKKEKKSVGKKVFSFRAEAETVDSWRLWADAKGMKVDDLGEKALQEYIKKHPLTEDQKQIFELKQKMKS